MTKADIRKMLEEAGPQLYIIAKTHPMIASQLTRFAKLVAQAERKACAFEAEWCIQNGVEHHIPGKIRARK